MIKSKGIKKYGRRKESEKEYSTKAENYLLKRSSTYYNLQTIIFGGKIK